MDAVDLILNDHQLVRDLGERLRTSDDAAAKKKIMSEIIRQVSMHSAMEEEFFYPFIRRFINQGDSLADRSLEEHLQVKLLLDQIDKLVESDADFDKEAKQVLSLVTMHMDEEERDILPQVKQLVPREEALVLGRNLQMAKAMAPTRPHADMPLEPPLNIALGPTAAAIDKIKDTTREFPSDTDKLVKEQERKAMQDMKSA